jgi:hypothetical protein
MPPKYTPPINPKDPSGGDKLQSRWEKLSTTQKVEVGALGVGSAVALGLTLGADAPLVAAVDVAGVTAIEAGGVAAGAGEAAVVAGGVGETAAVGEGVVGAARGASVAGKVAKVAGVGGVVGGVGAGINAIGSGIKSLFGGGSKDANDEARQSINSGSSGGFAGRSIRRSSGSHSGTPVMRSNFSSNDMTVGDNTPALLRRVISVLERISGALNVQIGMAEEDSVQRREGALKGESNSVSSSGGGGSGGIAHEIKKGMAAALAAVLLGAGAAAAAPGAPGTPTPPGTPPPLTPEQQAGGLSDIMSHAGTFSSDYKKDVKRLKRDQTAAKHHQQQHHTSHSDPIPNRDPISGNFSGRQRAFLSWIASKEGGPDQVYDQFKPGGKSKFPTAEKLFNGRHLSDLNLNELIHLQTALHNATSAAGVANGQGTSAVGSGQFEKKTLFGLSPNNKKVADGLLGHLGIHPDQYGSTKFTAQLQNRLTLQNAVDNHIDPNKVDQWKDDHEALGRLGNQWQSRQQPGFTRKGKAIKAYTSVQDNAAGLNAIAAASTEVTSTPLVSRGTSPSQKLQQKTGTEVPFWTRLMNTISPSGSNSATQQLVQKVQGNNKRPDIPSPVIKTNNFKHVFGT